MAAAAAAAAAAGGGEAPPRARTARGFFVAAAPAAAPAGGGLLAGAVFLAADFFFFAFLSLGSGGLGYSLVIQSAAASGVTCTPPAPRPPSASAKFSTLMERARITRAYVRVKAWVWASGHSLCRGMVRFCASGIHF